MSYKWKPSKSAAREYAAKMQEIEKFCRENGIDKSASGDSYYFEINGQKYRVSNHTVEASNAAAYNDLGEQVRDKYHADGRLDDTVYIHAGKTRIIEIYENIKSGKAVDGFGRVRA